MVKVRIACPWDTSENITNRLLCQFETPEISLTDIKFVYDDSYDVAICFNNICLKTDSSKQYYIFPNEPFWNGSHQKEYNEPNCTVFGFCKDGYIGNNIVTPAHLFYGGVGPWRDFLDIWCYDYLTTTSFNKTKDISCTITDISREVGLYPKRINVRSIVDNLPFIETGVSIHKIDYVEDYKFTLTVENDYCHNWVTEKFFDAILTDCIPIYYGCSNIKDLFPEDGYILLDNIDDMEYVQDTLIDIHNNIDEIYNQKITGARKIKERYFKDYNLLKKIIEIL